jgi:peptidoglycan LD-endopeptidase LytH
MLISKLRKYQGEFAPVVPVDFQTEKYLIFDFSVANPLVNKLKLWDTAHMKRFVGESLQNQNAKAGVGGYDEERNLYQKSKVFEMENEVRSIHLGIDIWMSAYTPIFAPLHGKIHSLKNNANFGDYGPTIILEHTLDELTFYTLYGHLSIDSLEKWQIGQTVDKGQKIAELGDEDINGGWAPHLHFQIISDMLGNEGDFIGVAPKSERDYYLSICPNPNLILKIPKLN